MSVHDNSPVRKGAQGWRKTYFWCASAAPSAPTIHALAVTMPTLVRGVPQPEPILWTRGQDPPVEYTNRPLMPPPPLNLTRAGEKKRKCADARLRRALVDAWRDPARARKDLLAAGTAYADLRDAQGAPP